MMKYTTNSVFRVRLNVICGFVNQFIRTMKYSKPIMDSVFRETLRSELDFQDIKVKELAVKTGISQRTLEGYLGARGSIPPADVAVKIAQVLNVSVEYLVTGDSEQNAKSKDAAGGCLADAISGLPMGKRQLLKELLAVLQNFDVARKPQAE